MKNLKGFTSIELIIALAIIGILISIMFGENFSRTPAERRAECVKQSADINEEDRLAFCIDQIAEEDRNRAIMYSTLYD